MTKNSSFCVLWTFSWVIPHIFGVLGRFTCFRVMTKNSFFAFYGHFHELLATVLGFQDDLHVWEVWPKTRRFFILWPFSWPLAHSFWALGPFTCLRVMSKNSYIFLHFADVFMSYSLWFSGSRDIYNDHSTLYMFEGMTKNLSFRVLWPFSCAIAHSFGVPRRFTCLRGMTKNSLFLHFMAVFMSYCP